MKLLSYLKIVLIVVIGMPLYSVLPEMGTADHAYCHVFVDRTTVIILPEVAAEVFIATPEIADVHLSSTKMLYIIGKKQGTTSLVVSNGKGKIILERTIQVHFDRERLKKILAESLKEEKIEIQEAAEGVILQGSVSTAAAVDTAIKIAKSFVGEKSQIINNLTVDSPLQINLRVKIIEVDRTVKNSLGINWDATLKGGNFAFGTFTGTQFINNSWTKKSGLVPNLPFTLDAGSGTGNNFALKFQSPQAILNSLLTALESEGLVTTLAEPNLTAISGQSATFLSGGELGILMPSTLGSAPSVEYKSYGISLEFKPVVLDKGRINIYVKPEVSFPDYSSGVTISNGAGGTTTIPNILTRRAETVVELGSGESFVIAGLLYNDLNNQLQKVPGLGDLPGIGALFRQASVNRQDTEVMIVVTPYIVEPLNGNVPSTPVDGLKYSSLNDVFFHNRLIDPNAAEFEKGADKLAGDAGFSVEEA